MKSQPKLPGKVQRPAPKTVPAESRPVPQIPEWAAATAFFLVFYLCLWKWVDVRLIYHGGGHMNDFPTFYWGWEFARDFRTHPGGLAEYVSALLAQALFSSWYGALVLTLQAGLIYLAGARLLRRFGGRLPRVVALIPPVVLLIIYSRYRHYSLPVMSFTAGITGLWAWAQLTRLNPPRRLAVAVLCVAVLYTAIPSALLVFVPGVAALELRFRGAGTGAGLLSFLVLSVLVPPVVGAVLFGFARGEAYAKLLPLVWDPLVWRVTGAPWVGVLYSLPLLICVAAAVQIGSSRKTSSAEQVATGSSHSRLTPVWNWLAPLVGLWPALVVYLALNPQLKAALAVDYLAWHGRWAEVFTAAKPNPNNPYVACAVAQASYHLGKLTVELPNMASAEDLLLSSDKLQSHWKKSDLYFDLGYVNMALHHLTEAVEFYGERPLLLQRLALVNLALGNVSTAKVYLLTLTRAPFQGAWARRYLDELKADPALANDPQVSRLRQLMVKRDSVVALSPDQELIMLLNANRQNRMAFEYLMTYYLLTKNLSAFVQNISRAKDFPGFEIPPLWDEGLVLASRLSGRRIEVPGHFISPEATTRVETMAQKAQKYGDNADLARKELAADYAHTYMFYWCFHL